MRKAPLWGLFDFVEAAKRGVLIAEGFIHPPCSYHSPALVVFAQNHQRKTIYYFQLGAFGGCVVGGLRFNQIFIMGVADRVLFTSCRVFLPL